MSNRELDHLYLEYPDELEETGRMVSDADPGINYDRNTKDRRSRDRKIRSIAALLIGVLAGILICAGILGISSISNSKAEAADLHLDYEEKIDLILSYLDAYYLNDLNEEEIGDLLARGLLQNIGDKYAEYYTEEEFDKMLEEMNGEYAGIGIQIVMNDENQVEVYKVFDGSPAKEAGIRIKDLIVEADGVRDFETLDDLVSIVRGPEGTDVDVVVLRGEEEIPFTITRRYITTESIYSEMLTDTVGYIQISEFNLTTVQQFTDALDSLEEQGMEAVIMDLRDNPGGDYDSVVAMCDRVLPEGVIVSVEDKQGGIMTENSDARCLEIPIVLLVNENTASAAELFTMALHDYGMAQIVGTQTYGKGIVQSLFRLIDGSGLKFTTEKYYGPKGDWIQDEGIAPDVVVEFPEEVYEDGVISLEEDIQLQKAAELLGFDLPVEELTERRAQEQEETGEAIPETQEEEQEE
ncbi:MAG: S41 family peptidase [Parasporobacterium sp.]|nr:S41 family peptidase [Parasporobacterium sp.]